MNQNAGKNPGRLLKAAGQKNGRKNHGMDFSGKYIEKAKYQGFHH